jgi:hypothetical protein
MAIRFVSKATVKNKLVRSSNVWDGSAVYNPFTLVGNYDALATVTVGVGGLSSITFAGIPQTGYSHLQIRGIAKTNVNSNSDGNFLCRFNDDSGSNYSGHIIRGDGSSATSDAGANLSYLTMGYATGSNANNTNTFASYVIDILDYSNVNKYKTTRQLEGYDLNGVEGSIFLRSNSWRSFNGINKITFSNVTFAQYSQFALYGVKA